MYCKLFASLYQGTLRGHAHEILVFTNLLAHCDAKGYVDKHFKAIAEEVGLSRQEVESSIRVLESPDPESRSPELDGARIVRMDEHRNWGWRIVNHAKYRAIKDEDDRREQNRIAQERFRNKNKQSKPPSAQAEAEAEAIDRDKEIPVELPPGFPKTEAEAKAVVGTVGCTEDFAVETWNKAMGRHGRDAKDVPIRSWPHYLKSESNFQTNRDEKEKNHVIRNFNRPTAPDRNAGTYNAKPLSDAAKSKIR